MKKKLYRERYNMVNGERNTLKKELTVEDIKQIKLKEDKKAGTVKVKKITTKKGKKKND